ncbi:DUF2183 domain-containing protein [Endozoicomonas sp. SM1973]|uniref:DUF2183 domain-containing protein n=1 Tax=Spartinivicinus marinus TaxID=2994442 RepID=A0A853IGT7_9GAMM|nr:phosphatase domain-containing protein [Spartinivicinus marinus]MCX4026879.1 DUF2183 domain-containing protein [Spartinivicinus marinus]NYZ66776.1 DUF2183 domain-containing protein [Spartinivicinus marinus]
MFYTIRLYTTLILCSIYIFLTTYGHASSIKAHNKLADGQAVSNIKSDEYVQFFRSSAWFDETSQLWYLPIHGWVYEPEKSIIRKQLIARSLKAKYGLSVTSQQTEKNFDRRVNLLIADNERNKTIIIKIEKQHYTLPKSLPNGHFQDIITLTQSQVDQLQQNNQIIFSAAINSKDKRNFYGAVSLIPPEGISVISDIDDTIKVTQVTDHTKLMNYTFFQDFIPTAGMPALYQSWAQQGITFHFVSSSPWHLYQPLAEFADTAGYPWASYSLKYIRFKDETLLNLFKKGTETKPQQIEAILKVYPKRKFILVGDSGEQDPEVYGELMRQYPKQIIKAFIRNVNNSLATENRYKKAFSGINGDKWQLFKDPKEVQVLSFLNKN